MGLVNITDTELAMFLEDRLSEKDAAEITAAINDAETLWLLGEMTNTKYQYDKIQ